MTHKRFPSVKESTIAANFLERYNDFYLNIFYQGGFAKCYEFVSQDSKKMYAAKIIDK